MGREASITLQELGRIKGDIARIEAIKAQRGKRCPRPVWEYVVDFTGWSEKTMRSAWSCQLKCGGVLRRWRGSTAQNGAASPWWVMSCR